MVTRLQLLYVIIIIMIFIDIVFMNEQVTRFIVEKLNLLDSNVSIGKG